MNNCGSWARKWRKHGKGGNIALDLQKSRKSCLNFLPIFTTCCNFADQTLGCSATEAAFPITPNPCGVVAMVCRFYSQACLEAEGAPAKGGSFVGVPEGLSTRQTDCEQIGLG